MPAFLAALGGAGGAAAGGSAAAGGIASAIRAGASVGAGTSSAFPGASAYTSASRQAAFSFGKNMQQFADSGVGQKISNFANSGVGQFIDQNYASSHGSNIASRPQSTDMVKASPQKMSLNDTGARMSDMSDGIAATAQAAGGLAAAGPLNASEFTEKTVQY